MPKLKLTRYMKEGLVASLTKSIEGPREASLLRQEHSIVLRTYKHRYGNDVFDRCRALPEGWLGPYKHLRLKYEVWNRLPHYRVLIGSGRNQWDSTKPDQNLSLSDYAPLPISAHDDWDEEMIGPALMGELHALFTARVDLHEGIKTLSTQTYGALTGFRYVEDLAAEWPEGYTHFPQKLLEAAGGFPVPAPNLNDLNAQIEAMRAGEKEAA